MAVQSTNSRLRGESEQINLVSSDRPGSNECDRDNSAIRAWLIHQIAKRAIQIMEEHNAEPIKQQD